MRIKKTDMSDSKRIAKNTMLLYFRMILVMGVSLYTSRIVLKELGVSDYGVYSLVGGFIGLFSFLNGAMSSATQRYLTFDLGKKDDARLQKTFSITLTIHAAIALIVLLLAETIGLWYVNHKMIFPPERAFAVNVVYQLSIAASLVSVIQVPYNALIIARERMNIFAYISIVEVSLRLVIVFMLVWFGADKLISYAVLTFIVSLLIQLFYQIYCRRNYRESKYRFEWDKAYYKELIAYSGWSLFGSLAAVARSQGNNVVLNLFFGTTVNAAYGIMNTVNNAINSFVSNFQTASRPQIIKLYASDEHNKMESLINKTSKYSYYLSLVLMAPVFVNIDYILRIWLVTPPAFSALFIRIALAYTLIDTLSGSLMTGIHATGNIKMYQIVVGSLVSLNLPLTYIFLKFDIYSGPEISLYIWLVISVVSLWFRLHYLKKSQNYNLSKYYKQVILRVVIVSLISAAMGYILNIVFYVSTISQLLFQTIVYCLFMVIIVMAVGIGKDERKMIVKYCVSFIRKNR